MSDRLGWYPTIILDPASPMPPYAQIRAQIVAWIAAQRLIAGAPLPSVRQLARDLDIAPNTVVRAYEELERGGWILSVPRKGFVVATIPMAFSAAERQQRLWAAVADLLLVAWQLQIDAATLHAEIDRQMQGDRTAQT